jgi:hypothetical protein
MVIQRDRRRLAEAMRHLAAGQITNDEFEERGFFRSEDPAVREIQSAAWQLYSDNRSYRLQGKHRLSDESRTAVARCVLFLDSPLEFEWPLGTWRQGGILYFVLNCITVGFSGKLLLRQYSEAGDFGVWPFIRTADYETALRSPRLLNRAV